MTGGSTEVLAASQQATVLGTAIPVIKRLDPRIS
jgi:hypothetical protein